MTRRMIFFIAFDLPSEHILSFLFRSDRSEEYSRLSYPLLLLSKRDLTYRTPHALATGLRKLIELSTRLETMNTLL